MTVILYHTGEGNDLCREENPDNGCPVLKDILPLAENVSFVKDVQEEMR